MFIENKHHKCSTSILGICLLPIFWNWNTLDYHLLYSITRTRRFLAMRIPLVYRFSSAVDIVPLNHSDNCWVAMSAIFFSGSTSKLSPLRGSPEGQLLWMDTSERLCHKKGKLNGETIGDWKQSRPAWRFWGFGYFSDSRCPIAGDVTRSQNCLWGPTRERKHVHWYFDDLLFHLLYSFLGRLYLKLFKFNVPSCAITAITLTQLSTKFDCTQHLLFTASQPFKQAWNKEQAQGSQNLECLLSHLDPSVISIDHKWGRPFEHVNMPRRNPACRSECLNTPVLVMLMNWQAKMVGKEANDDTQLRVVCEKYSFHRLPNSTVELMNTSLLLKRYTPYS